FDRQQMHYKLNVAFLSDSAKNELAETGRADGSVHVDGKDQFFAARIVSGKAFVLLRPKSVTRARWAPHVYSLVAAGLAALVLAGISAFLLARRIARPVGRVADAARSLARGTDPDPVPVEGAVELATLATAFNDLASQLARAREAERNFLLSVS